ncbi:hypothetical protein [Hymenobacter defluvii]|uniref:Uncharacterized protein n=1 Tax=Hymenobacter defluvii TaxID=2054411 RepID=A0ABS3TED3_9BACT|nr:hypothetical protein [Hymenobacter defluvii]MBO3272014.1 hypothetical protein [Hymenobacter defluvii]
MYHSVIPDGQNGHYHITKVGDFEFVRPLEKLMELFIPSRIRFLKAAIDVEAKTGVGAGIPEETWMKVLLREAMEAWEEKKKEYMTTKSPQALWDVLAAGSKKDQVKALRGLALSWDEFFAFVCQAGENLGFTYSSYRAHLDHKGLDRTKLPRLIRLHKNNAVESVGPTTLTPGQLKQVITARKVINAKFLDKGDEWHCFFYTEKSIAGKENYQGEQPHIHYISSKWGIPRADIIAAIQSGNYKATPVHIDLIKRHQDEEDED